MSKAAPMRKALRLSLVALLALTGTACEKGLAWGDPHAVIVVAPQEWWPQLQDTVFAVLSPDIFTLREERTFRVTYQDPLGPDWVRLRMFREEVLIGATQDPWMAEALSAVRASVPAALPAIVQARDVWARNQAVTMILVDSSGDLPAQVASLLPEVHGILERRFRAGVAQRMFLSGRNSALSDSLLRTAGFALLLPKVYRWGEEDSVFVFRNDNPDPSELIRQFTVTWRTPVPEGFTADSLLDWRQAVTEGYFNFPQVVDRERLRTARLPGEAMEVLELRGGWANPPETLWPAAGPLILRQVTCPGQDRLYLVDAWLYAPGKDKWEYMLQLETILGSFRCGGPDPNR